MSRLTPFAIIVLTCWVILTLATIAWLAGCPDCFFDNSAPMNGPASADGRRTISVKIDASWETQLIPVFGMQPALALALPVVQLQCT